MKCDPHVHFPATLFFDGNCPLCVTEVQWLMKRNIDNRLLFADITEPTFKIPAELGETTTILDLNNVIHMQLKNGDIVKGLDATYMSYAAIGMGFLIAPLRWRAFKFIADKGYVYFANNRQSISKKFAFLTGRNPCKDGVCDIKKKGGK